MIEFNTIGVFMREHIQKEPLDYLRNFFASLSTEIILLKKKLPAQPLDLVIVMGGDGTVLQALDLVHDCPVLAINYGTVGFLTAGDRDDLGRVLKRLVNGDYIVSERLLLSCSHEGKTMYAVNEVALRASLRMVQVEVSIDGTKIRTIRGDGVIVGTPTGSTAYLLSTGAPVVMPDTDCIVLNGINEYNYSSRTLILPPQKQIRLRVLGRLPKQQVSMLVDGTPSAFLVAEQEVLVTGSSRRARLIFFEENYFFHNLSSRLSWN